MRKVPYIGLVMLCLIISQTTYSQVYLKINADSSSLQSDSVLLNLAPHRGVINWEISSDMETWLSLDGNRDTLGVRIDSTAYYRAILIDGTCNPVLSDTVKVFEKVTKISGMEFSCDQKGGVFLLSNGIKIKIPPGALEEEITINMYPLDSVSAGLEIPFVRNSAAKFLYALKFSPENITFQKTVKIRVPASGFSSNSLPLIHTYYSQKNEWEEYNGAFLCSQKDGFIEFSLTNLNPFFIEAFAEVFRAQNNLKATDDCRRGLIRIRSTTHDMSRIYKDVECYAFMDSGSVKFLDCKDLPPEYWVIREISPNCTPKVEMKINHSPDKSMLKVGEAIELSFFTHVEGFPLEKQFISVALPEGFSERILSGFTGEDGVKTFTVTPTAENLNANIDYLADFEYCLQFIKASGNGITEEVCLIKPLKTEIIEKSKAIIIYDDCTDPFQIICSSVSDVNCIPVKNQLVNTIEIAKTSLTLDVEDTYDIKVKGLNILNEEISGDLDLEYSSANLEIASVDNSGTITAIKEGNTNIAVERCEQIVGNIDVEVREKGAPVPGNDGIITTSDMIEDYIIVNFTSATDDNTAQNQLQYLPLLSTSPNIQDITEALENGTVLIDWYPNFPDEFTLTNLSPDTDYWINILVQDKDGNRAAYEMHHFTTSALFVDATLTYNALLKGLSSQIITRVIDHKGNEFVCENPEYKIVWQYPPPSTEVITISPEGKIEAINPGVVHIQISCGTAKPFITAVTVGFEKTLNFEVTWDSEIYKLCGCQNPVDFSIDWYKATYTGTFDFVVWLPYEYDDEVTISVEAEESIWKTIESPVCENDSIIREWSASTSFAGRVCSLNEFIGGEEYSFYFDYDHKVELWVHLYGRLHSTALGETVGLRISSYSPDVCIPYIERVEEE